MLRTEHRSVDLVDAEVKGRLFRGYAAVFNTPWSERLTEATGYVEKVKPGVFRKALGQTEDVPLLWQHDRNQLLATTGSGDVRIKEDGKGLLTEAKMPSNHLADYVLSLVETRNVRGMSYGIELDPKRDVMLQRDAGSGIYTKTVIGARRLLDVSLTWEPAYTATTAELRSTGFVAVPLQELLDGEEPQTEDAVAEQTPDESEEAWWGDDPQEATSEEKPRGHWDFYYDQLSKEV